MAGVETYILTIENDTEKSKITSVKKGTDVLKLPDGGIDLADVNASAQLTEAINPAQQAEAAEEQNNGLPVGDTIIKFQGKKRKVLFEGTLNELIAQLSKPSNSESVNNSKQNLLTYINRRLNSDDWKKEGVNISEELDNVRKGKEYNNIIFGEKDQLNQLLGGNHHTRKRTHKPRNAKSNTRKGHIYRTNRRRTHGKSSAHGKKQTRRNVNH